jgi:hypothetical protein
MGYISVIVESGVEENKKRGSNRPIVSDTDEHGGDNRERSRGKQETRW